MPRKEFSTVRDEEHVISRANGRQSVEQILVDSGVIGAGLSAGTILKKDGALGGRYRPYAAADGAAGPFAILGPNLRPSDPIRHERTAADVRDGEHNGHKLFFPAGITAGEKAVLEAALATQGLLVRY